MMIIRMIKHKYIIVILTAVLSAILLLTANKPLQVSAAQFPDVSDPSKPYYTAVYWAVDNGIVKGYSNGNFGPEDSCTREQFVVMIWRLADKPEADSAVNFTDISSSRSTFKAIQWAVSEGIIKGFSDGAFKPGDTVTRQQVAIMLWRMAGKQEVATVANFSDISKSGSNYKAIQWGSSVGLIKGFADGTFGPDQNCLRQQIVIFLYRYNKNVSGGSVLAELDAGTISYVKNVYSYSETGQSGQYTQTKAYSSTVPYFRSSQGSSSVLDAINNSLKNAAIKKVNPDNNRDYSVTTVSSDSEGTGQGAKSESTDIVENNDLSLDNVTIMDGMISVGGTVGRSEIAPGWFSLYFERIGSVYDLKTGKKIDIRTLTGLSTSQLQSIVDKANNWNSSSIRRFVLADQDGRWYEDFVINENGYIVLSTNTGNGRFSPNTTKIGHLSDFGINAKIYESNDKTNVGY